MDKDCFHDIQSQLDRLTVLLGMNRNQTISALKKLLSKRRAEKTYEKDTKGANSTFAGT